MKDRITIGITDCSKYLNYERWILAEEGVDTIRLGYGENNLDALGRCDGLLFTGGEDVDPELYGKPEYLRLCDADNMDRKRDDFELSVLEWSQQNSVPVLGICRGLQITNVFFKGTLVPDIPTTGKPDHAKIKEGSDRYHEVLVNPFSQLKEIAGVSDGEVNSAHHQSADKIGAGLVPAAYSADGVVEALERTDRLKSFLLLVQWHPERMNNMESPLSRKIKMAFLEKCKKSTV